MATWANDHTFTLSLSKDGKYTVSDGSNIYFIVSNEDAWRYNLASKTETQMLDGSAIANLYTSGVKGIAYLNGEVYFVIGYTSMGLASGYVQKWTGVLNGLTTVYTVMENDDASAYPGIHQATLRLQFDDVYGAMVVVGMSYFDDSAGYPHNVAAQVSAYSTNGSSWNSISFAADSPGNWPGATFFTTEAGEFPQGVYNNFLSNQPNAFSDVYDIFKFTGTGWSVIVSDEGEGYHHTDPVNSYHWTANVTGERTSDLNFSGYVTPDGTISVPHQLNLPYSLGYKFNGANTEIYTYQSGSWVLLDTIVGTNLTISTFIRASNGNVYAVGQNGSNFQIWLRDASLPVALDRRLYIYRTADKGLTWTSKKVET